MKILKIWSTFQSELKYHDHYLADEMREKGIETVFLSSDKINKEYIPFLKYKNIKAGKDDYNGSKIIRLKSFEFMNKAFILDIRQMYKEIKYGEYDVIHIFGISNPISIICLFLIHLSRKNIPVFFNDHSNPILHKTSFFARIYHRVSIVLFKKLSKNVKKVITPNLASYKLIKSRYCLKNSQISIIPLGFKKDIFYYMNKKNTEGKKLLLGFAGKLLPNKKIESLIDVLYELNDDNISCEVVGLYKEPDKYQESLIQYAQDKKVNIKFMTLINDPLELAKFYNYIDVAVFPGSISITTLEANGCGTPVILYNSIDGLKDRVENGRGFLFETKDELKEYIIKYKNMKYENKIDNVTIEQNSLNYSWEEISNKYLSLYNEVINDK